MEVLIGGTRLVFSLPIYALIGLAGVLSLFQADKWREGPCSTGLRVLSRCHFSVLLAGLYMVARACLSPVPALMVSDLLSVLAGLTVYYLALGPAGDSRARKIVLWWFFSLAGFEVFLGLRQFHVGDGWMPFGLVRSATGQRAGGTFVSPNHLAGLLEVVSLLGLGVGIWGRGGMFERGVAGYVGLLSGVGVIVSGSRGGYLSLGMGLIFFAAASLWIVWKIWRHRFFGVCCAVILFFVGGGGGVIFLMRQSASIRYRLDLLAEQLQRDKLDVRVGNWAAAIDQFRLAPVFGTGAGTHLYYGRYFRRLPMQQDPVHAHGDYLELLAEYGWVGCGLMLWVLVLHGRVVLGSLTRVSTEQSGQRRSLQTLALVSGGGASLAAMAMHSVVDFNLHIPGNALIWSAVLGWVGRLEVQTAGQGRGMPFFRWVVGICGGWLLLMAIRHFPEEWYGEKARVALRRGDLTESVEQGSRAVQAGGRNPEVHFLLGEALRVQGLRTPDRMEKMVLLEKALESFRRALGLFSQDENVWVRKAQTLDGLGRYEDAGGAYQEALKLDPRLGVLYLSYARHLELVGRDAESKRIREIGERLKAGDPSLAVFWGAE
jgi:O-antigen ligase